MNLYFKGNCGCIICFRDGAERAYLIERGNGCTESPSMFAYDVIAAHGYWRPVEFIFPHEIATLRAQVQKAEELLREAKIRLRESGWQGMAEDIDAYFAEKEKKG